MAEDWHAGITGLLSLSYLQGTQATNVIGARVPLPIKD
jgi:hypothetical protein